MQLMTYSFLVKISISYITYHLSQRDGTFSQFLDKNLRPKEMKSLMQDDTESQKAV